MIYTLDRLVIDEVTARFFRIEPQCNEEPEESALAEVIPFNKSCEKAASNTASNAASNAANNTASAYCKIAVSDANNSGHGKEQREREEQQEQPHNLYCCMPIEVMSGRKIFCDSLHITDIKAYSSAQYALWGLSMIEMDAIMQESRSAGIPIGGAVEQSGKVKKPVLVADTSLYTLVKRKPEMVSSYPSLPWEWLDWSHGNPHYVTNIEVPMHLPINASCGINQERCIKEVTQLAAMLTRGNNGIVSLYIDSYISSQRLSRLQNIVNTTLQQHLDREPGN